MSKFIDAYIQNTHDKYLLYIADITPFTNILHAYIQLILIIVLCKGNLQFGDHLKESHSGLSKSAKSLTYTVT